MVVGWLFIIAGNLISEACPGRDGHEITVDMLQKVFTPSAAFSMDISLLVSPSRRKIQSPLLRIKDIASPRATSLTASGSVRPG